MDMGHSLKNIGDGTDAYAKKVNAAMGSASNFIKVGTNSTQQLADATDNSTAAINENADASGNASAQYKRQVDAQKLIKEAQNENEKATITNAQANDRLLQIYQKLSLEGTNSVTELQGKYAELTNDTVGAALAATQLALATDEVYKKAKLNSTFDINKAISSGATLAQIAELEKVIEKNKEIVALKEKINTINPNVAPIQEEIDHYGMLTFEITRAEIAEFERKKATGEYDSTAIDAEIAKLTQLGSVQEELLRKSSYDEILKANDNGMSNYIDNWKKYSLALAEANDKGFDTAPLERYKNSIIQDFNQSSPAGKQAHEFFNILQETSTQGFEAMMQNGASASKAMIDMFKNLGDSIAATFMKLGQSSLFDWLENGTMKAGGWLNVISGTVAIGAKLLSNVLSADAPIRTPSTAESYQSKEYGAATMAIVDSVARDNGFNFATKAAAIFNNNVNQFSSAIQNNISTLSKGLMSLGDVISSTQAWQRVSVMVLAR
jgi:hypothetical protein